MSELKCPLHRKDYVTTTCTSNTCLRAPLICPICPDQHSDHSQLSFQEWVSRVSRSVEDGLKIHRWINETLQGWDQVQKWCEDDEMHLRKVEQHCNAQKQLIADDLTTIKKNFEEKCDSIQQTLNLQLEDFNNRYKDAFKSAKFNIDQILYKQFSAYQNPNNIIYKLQQSNPEEARDICLNLKKLINKVKTVESDKVAFQDNLTSLTKKITEMTYNLPVYQFSQNIDAITNQLIDLLSNQLQTRLNTTPPPQPPSPISKSKKQFSRQLLQKQNSFVPENSSRSKSPRRVPSSNTHIIAPNNKTLYINNTQDLSLKPLKKYQLDFQVAAIEVVNDTLFALSCSNDPYLRIFDTIQKRIHTLQAHNNPIQLIQKSMSDGAPLQQNNSLMNGPRNNQQKVPYMFTFSADAFIVWTFDSVNGASSSGQGIPHIFSRYNLERSITSFCHLQDNSTIVMGDKDGGVEVYNFQSQKIQQACMKGKHSNAITSIVVIKKFDKFLVGSSDQTISIWRLLYNPNNTQFENTYCESVINCGLGSINTLHVLGNGFVVVANLEGSLKLVNLVNQQVSTETDLSKNTTGIVDILVAEEQRSKDQFCVMSLGQSQKCLRFWKIQQKDDWWSQQEHKVDVALSLGDNMCRSKLQFVHMHQNSQNALVLITNETNKELLVYEVIGK